MKGKFGKIKDKVSQNKLDEWLVKYASAEEQVFALERIRRAAKHLSRELIRAIPESNDRTVVICKLQECVGRALVAVVSEKSDCSQLFGQGPPERSREESLQEPLQDLITEVTGECTISGFGKKRG
jgi:hypothetical protein